MTSTAERVPIHTNSDVNRRIQNQIARRVRYYASRPEEVSTRLRELDEEWDIERAIEANASALAFTGVVLGSLGNRRWFLLPAAVTAFLFQHAIQGWCPPVPILRRFGFRTADEINQERVALKALRGDFDRMAGAPDKAEAALRAVRVRSAA
jgi:hypothetical protein